jgi:hypothetical protein
MLRWITGVRLAQLAAAAPLAASPARQADTGNGPRMSHRHASIKCQQDDSASVGQQTDGCSPVKQASDKNKDR